MADDERQIDERALVVAVSVGSSLSLSQAGHVTNSQSCFCFNNHVDDTQAGCTSPVSPLGISAYIYTLQARQALCTRSFTSSATTRKGKRHVSCFHYHL